MRLDVSCFQGPRKDGNDPAEFTSSLVLRQMTFFYLYIVQRVFRLAGTVSKKTNDKSLSPEILVGL